MTGFSPGQQAEVVVIGSSMLLDGVATYLEKHCDLTVARVDSPEGAAMNSPGIAPVVIGADQPAASEVMGASDWRQLWIGLDSAGERIVVMCRWEIASPCMEDVCRIARWGLTRERELEDDGRGMEQIIETRCVS